MCGVQPAWCRLCLASDILPPYLDLTEDETGQAEELSSLLSLSFSFSRSPQHFPRYVCAICVGIFQSFLRLRETAQQNEKILQTNEKMIRQSGLKSFLHNYRLNPTLVESHNFLLEEKMEDCEYNYTEDEDGDDPDSSSQSVVKEESHPVDSNTNTGEPMKQESQERNPVVVSILKSAKTKHKASHSSRVQCTVEGCHSTFGREKDMKRHVQNVHVEKKVCPICGEAFKKVKEHMKIRHENAKIPCEFCDKVYYTESGLQYHVNVVHLKAKKKICHICAGEFRDMKAHLAYQHGGGKEERSVACRVVGCGRMLRNSQVEKIHYNAAHLKLKEKCPICSGWFKNINVHISQIHKNHHKFSCEKCGKAFNKKCDLKLHDERVHLQKRYTCPECGKVISKIREHLRTVHKVTDINMENIKSEQLIQSVS